MDLKEDWDSCFNIDLNLNVQDDDFLNNIIQNRINTKHVPNSKPKSPPPKEVQSNIINYEENIEHSRDSLIESFSANMNLDISIENREYDNANIDESIDTFSDNLIESFNKSFNKDKIVDDKTKECVKRNKEHDSDSTFNPVTKSKSITGLTDIIGLADVKQVLKESILYPLKYPHLFAGPRTAWSRALLFGPPGVGKTYLVNAIAAEVDLALYCITSSDLISAWYGDTEKKIRKLFGELGDKNCIVFIDEIDSICRKRCTNDTDQSRRMQSELLVHMDHYESRGMFLICATNCPWDLDSAFMRRFQQQIYVPLPTREARELLFLKYLDMKNDPKTWKNWQELLNKSTGLTGSDIKSIVRAAFMIPLREMQNAKYWQKRYDGKYLPCSSETPNAICCKIESLPSNKVWCRQVNFDDIWISMKKHVRTVTEESLKPYQIFIKEHSTTYS